VADDTDAGRPVERPGTEPPVTDRTDAGTVTDADGNAAMRARTWTIAANYRDPADYDVPPLPDWTVIRSDDGGLVVADPDDETACIRADDPVTVRR